MMTLLSFPDAPSIFDIASISKSFATRHPNAETRGACAQGGGDKETRDELLPIFWECAVFSARESGLGRHYASGRGYTSARQLSTKPKSGISQPSGMEVPSPLFSNGGWTRRGHAPRVAQASKPNSRLPVGVHHRSGCRARSVGGPREGYRTCESTVPQQAIRRPRNRFQHLHRGTWALSARAAGMPV